MGDLIQAYDQRKVWLEGVGTAIVGRVNAGKSSLLNRLLHEERALVTPIPGTTRDVIESTVQIEGIPLRLMDTAGIRKVRGEVERMGIRLTEQKMHEADLVLIVVDGSRSLHRDDLDLIGKARDGKALLILNKSDLPSRIRDSELASVAGDLPLVRTSALRGDGIDHLCQCIRDTIMGEEDTAPTSPFVPNLRHREALAAARGFLQQAAANLRADLPLDIVAVDLKAALEALGRIVGETAPEDILDRIFSRFCLGK
jgi:tRNA modification GTPase